jgi:hypothetical protein
MLIGGIMRSRSRLAVLGFALALTAAPAAARAQQTEPALPPRPQRQPGASGESRPHTHPGNPAAALRLLIAHQMRFRSEHGRYATRAEETGFPEHAGVTLRIVANGGAGYSVVATSATEECAYFQGTVAAPRPYAGTTGTIHCQRRPRS